MRYLAGAMLLLILTTSSLSGGRAQAASNCTRIHFAPGAVSAEIIGDAPPNDALCYAMRTGAGQRARIRVLEGPNVIVTIPGVADARDDLTFTTDARQYEILVGQLMRAAQPQPFRILVSVE